MPFTQAGDPAFPNSPPLDPPSSDPAPFDQVALSAYRRSLLALLIEPAYYAAQAATRFDTTDELVDHYLQVGWRHGFDPSPTFRSARYPDAPPGARATENPFVHYLFEVVGEDALTRALAGLGAAQIGRFRAHFDTDWYLARNPDVALSGDDALVHYLTSGWRELRDPSPSFSTGGYLDLHPDVRASDIDPFRHWVLHGIDEGRSGGKAPPSPLDSWRDLGDERRSILIRMFDIDYYRSHLIGAGSDHGSALAERIDAAGMSAGDITHSFDAARYVADHPGLGDTGQIPFLHYLFDVVGEDALRALFVAPPLAVTQAVCAQFDTAWYLYSYPDVEASGQDAFIHYMTVGWRKKHDPSRDFSTAVYLLRYPDIVEADVNPFRHWIEFGKAEGRSGASSASNFRNRPYAPSITAILINDAADPLTPDRVASITHQSHDDLSVLVVGDPLSRACRAALDAGGRGGEALSVDYLHDDGSLPPWTVLGRAVERTSCDLLWFVRGPGIPDFEFLARLASSFADGSVQLGFGRCLAPDDADGAIAQDELARRMNGWTRHATTPAALWFPEQLRPALLAADQHGFVWRRRGLDPDVWHRADDYRHLGLWHLLLHMASGGQIATVRDARVRIPAMSTTSPVPLDDDGFRRDVARLSTEVRSFWPGIVPDVLPGSGGTRLHVLIVTHGIFAGGAENLPIQLANELAGRGIIVSMLIFKTDVNPEMRATLNPGVSIYEADWVLEYGCERFIRDIGCSLIHSHGVVGEMFFFRLCERPLPVPYVATLHGSYEASTTMELPEAFLARIVRAVDLFVYTADKNLAPLLRHDVRPERLVKMINAMPVDEAPFPRSRAELGIAQDAIVFTLIARGIAEKGWSTAINAFAAVRERNPGRPMHLCLVGEGEETERLKPLHADDPSISFLGFQLRIHGLYRMTDVAIVPTRFAGESFPLCIIQALQVSVPVIATDIGEIASMLERDGVAGGIVVEESRDDEPFEARFTEAMHDLVDDERRRHLAAGAGILGGIYDMGAFTDQYVAVYQDVLRRFAASPLACTPERI